MDEYNTNPILCKNESREAIIEPQPLETKSLRFAYQKEYRFFWYSYGSSTNEPDHVDIRLIRGCGRQCLPNCVAAGRNGFRRLRLRIWPYARRTLAVVNGSRMGVWFCREQ